jgi:hypothetical protein
MDPLLFRKLTPVWVRPGTPPVVLTVRGVRLGTVFEGVALLKRGSRVGALCLRLVHGPHGWRVVEAARPEDGDLPEPEPEPPDHELDEFALVSEGSPIWT